MVARPKVRHLMKRVYACLALAASTRLAMPCAAQPLEIAAPGVIKAMPDTSDGIHAFQAFNYDIGSDAARAHAARYDYLWSASLYPVVAPWYQGHPAIVATHYIPYARDASYHTLKWFERNHPDWILYRCDRKTPAWEYGDTRTVPIDITNQDAVAYQLASGIYYARSYDPSGVVDGIAADNLSLNNLWGGCGAFRKNLWVQTFSGAMQDPAWRNATVRWVANASSLLHSQSPPLRLDGNTSPVFEKFDDDAERKIVQTLDGIFDEAGFTDYGSGLFSGAQWLNAERWLAYAQSIGKTWLSVNGFTPGDARIVEFAVASYLMEKGHSAAIFISTTSKAGVIYGREEWKKIYTAPIGTACGKMYFDQDVYFRRFTRGLAVVNASATRTLVVRLPQHRYTTTDGEPVGNALRLGQTTGVVLLTVNGCGA